MLFPALFPVLFPALFPAFGTKGWALGFMGLFAARTPGKGWLRGTGHIGMGPKGIGG